MEKIQFVGSLSFIQRSIHSVQQYVKSSTSAIVISSSFCTLTDQKTSFIHKLFNLNQANN